MAIRTQDSMSGFIAGDPELSFTRTGDARFYVRAGQQNSQREPDGTFTELEATYSDLVMFGRSAELAYEKFRKGDDFIAAGEVRTYMQHRDGQDVEREQFTASRIGHDNNLTRYDVDRNPIARDTPDRDAPGREAGGRSEAGRESANRGPVEAPAQEPPEDPLQAALAERAAQLDPEPPAATSGEHAQRESIAR